MRLTQVQYARRAKVTKQYVSKLVRSGRIPVAKDGKIDPRKADRARAAWHHPEMVRPKAAKKPAKKKPAATASVSAGESRQLSATSSLTQARAITENYKARSAKLDYEKAIGALLPKDEVLEAERRKNAQIRARFRRLARSVAPRLARGKTPAEIEEMLLAEIDLQLSELARDPLGMVPIAPESVPEPAQMAVAQ